MTSRSPLRRPALAAAVGLLLPLVAGIPAGAQATTSEPRSAQHAPRASQPAEEVGYAQISPVAGTLLPETRFQVTGVLGNKLPRKVQLNHTAGGTTTPLATTTSTAAGTFTFSGVRAPSTGTLVAVSPQQTLSVAAGASAQERARKAVRRVDELVVTVRKRKKVHTAAAAKVARARKGTSGAKMGKLLRKAGSAKIQLRVARKALTRARGRVVVTQAALVRRVVVPRAESKPVTVTVVQGQSASVTALPPIAQAGPTASEPATGAVVSARFSPARPGRTVRLEQLVAGEWRHVDSQAQDRSGHAVFQTAVNATFRAVTVATEEAAEVVTSSVPTQAWTLDFSDGFGGSSLDAGKWAAQNRPRGTGLRSCATTDASSYSVSGGVLNMGVSKDPAFSGQTCAYTDDKGVKHQLPFMRNTQIASVGKYDHTYGYAAARIKVQSAIGMHSSFWSQPVGETVPGVPAAGVEVDVMEYFGDYPREDGIASFQHVLQSNGAVVKTGRMFPDTALMKENAPFSASYHVYSVEWTPTSYVFRIDGREYHRTNKDISQSPAFLLLSNLTSSYELVNLKNFDDVAAVDWVQVWK